MPLDIHGGEFFPELHGAPFTIAPSSKWAGTPFMEMAAKHAASKFADAGALRPIKFMADDVLIQEYHGLGKLVFIFQRLIAGTEWFVPYECEITPEIAKHLATVGMWPTPTLDQYMAQNSSETRH
jgi:hypothetical protein